MNETERSFKKLMMKIGTAMLIFLVAFTVIGEIIVLSQSLLYSALDYRSATIAYNLIYALMYALPFAGAAAFLFVSTKRDTVPASKKLALPTLTPVYIIVAVAVTTAMSYINQYFVSVFNYSEFMSDAFGMTYDIENYEIALSLLTTAVIPGIFEELLFRGAVLTRLRPYGKGVSVVISAVLFGLMHQNAGQFLYATAAGLVLGWITVQTGSVVCAMVCHFFNNAVAVVQQVILAKLPEHSAIALLCALEFVLLSLGVIGALILARAYYKKRRTNDLSLGMFGRELEPEREMEHTVSPSRAARLFWTPTVIVFVCLSAAMAAMYLFLSLLYTGAII